MFLPVFVQDQEQFLCTSQSKCRQKNVATSPDDVVDQSGEPCLLFFSTFECLDAIRTLDNENIGMYWWHFRLDKVAVLFTRVVASIQNLETSYVDEEHTSTEDMAGVVRCKGHSRTRRYDLMGRDGYDG